MRMMKQLVAGVVVLMACVLWSGSLEATELAFNTLVKDEVWATNSDAATFHAAEYHLKIYKADPVGTQFDFYKVIVKVIVNHTGLEAKTWELNGINCLFPYIKGYGPSATGEGWSPHNAKTGALITTKWDLSLTIPPSLSAGVQITRKLEDATINLDGGGISLCWGKWIVDLKGAARTRAFDEPTFDLICRVNRGDSFDAKAWIWISWDVKGYDVDGKPGKLIQDLGPDGWLIGPAKSGTVRTPCAFLIRKAM